MGTHLGPFKFWIDKRTCTDVTTGNGWDATLSFVDSDSIISNQESDDHEDFWLDLTDNLEGVICLPDTKFRYNLAGCTSDTTNSSDYRIYWPAGTDDTDCKMEVEMSYKFTSGKWRVTLRLEEGPEWNNTDDAPKDGSISSFTRKDNVTAIVGHDIYYNY